MPHLTDFFWHHIPALLALIGLIILIQALRVLPWIYSLTVLPGTLLHELAHVLVGFVSNAHPTRISLLPKRHGKGWQLGSATFHNLTYYNALPVTLAPLILLALAYWLFIHWALTPGWHAFYLGGLYLTTNCLLAGWPSPTDWRHGWQYSWPMLLLGLCLLFAYEAWHRHWIHI